MGSALVGEVGVEARPRRGTICPPGAGGWVAGCGRIVSSTSVVCVSPFLSWKEGVGIGITGGGLVGKVTVLAWEVEGIGVWNLSEERGKLASEGTAGEVGGGLTGWWWGLLEENLPWEMMVWSVSVWREVGSVFCVNGINGCEKLQLGEAYCLLRWSSVLWLLAICLGRGGSTGCYGAQQFTLVLLNPLILFFPLYFAGSLTPPHHASS